MAKRMKLVRQFVVRNKLGLHARPASMFVKTATGFTAEITVAKDGNIVDGKSILGVLMLAAGQGAAISVTADGEDASHALHALEILIQDGFGEELG